MFKKTLKVATVLTLLFGCYAGYVRVFAMVVKNLESKSKGMDNAFIPKKSRSKLDSIDRARKSFGADHWTSEEKTTCYIGRDFWLYFQAHKQPLEKYDGKRIELKPVAVIVRTEGGKTNITVTADEGIFDVNQRPGLNGKSSPDKLNPKAAPEPFKVLKATLSKNVMLRHDRGTPDDPGDDLFVGPLTYADFNDETLQIASESDVLIRDRDTTITGNEFLIQLRPKIEVTADVPNEPRRGNGFDGVQSAILKKNVHVIFNDVGRTGFLPGAGTAKKTNPSATPAGAMPTISSRASDGRTEETPPPEPKPLDLTSAGRMTVTFPEPRHPARVGPPAPPLPTLIEFTRDVLAQVGKLDEKPDQLSCDHLDLVLYPAEAPPKVRKNAQAESASTESVAVAGDPGTQADEKPPAKGPDDESSGGGTFGNLALRSLKATGHAVWLKLSKQTTTIRGIELKHQKRGAGQLDVTNMLGQKGRRGLTIEKIDEILEGPEQGKIIGVTNVEGSNATIYGDGGDTNNATIYIQGPGRLETRTDRNQPAQRIAEWQDVLEVLNEPGPDPASPGKRVTFVGVPLIRDISKPDAPSSLDSSDRIIAWLKPKPAATTPARTPRGEDSPLSPGSGYELQHLRAYKDVHLNSPGQSINARELLNAEFKPAPIEVAAANPAPATASRVASTPPAQTAPPTDREAPREPEQQQQQTSAKKAPPDRKIDADKVWANVQLLPPPAVASAAGAGGARPATGGATPTPQYEIREVQLLQRVTFRQEPEEGKVKGSEATGEALYLFNEGENKVRMVLFNDVPKKTVSKDGVAGIAWATPAHLRQNLPPARISTDEIQLAGGIIGMDQTRDFAYVNGPGTLKQLVDRGMMADKNPVDMSGKPADPKAGDAAAKADPKTPAMKIQMRAGRPLSEKTELTINWTENMRFYGRSADYERRPDSAARAEFYGHVTAITEEKDSMLDCERPPSNPPLPSMITYTDRPVPLAKTPKAESVRAGTLAGNAPQAPAAQAPEPKPDLALIEMFGNAVAVNRKVDPLRPIVLQKQRIQSDHLIYNRRTGDFSSPGEGIVFLYDRKGSEPDLNRGIGLNERRMMGDRLVIPTSMRQDQDAGFDTPSPLDMEQQGQADEEDERGAAMEVPRGARPAGPSGGPRSRNAAPPRVAGTVKPRTQPNRPPVGGPPDANAVPPLILTQIKFAREMRGQFGTSNKAGASERREANFFGDVEVVRSPVADEFGIVERNDWNFRPPREVYFLTSQTLRVITEPPLPGSPPNAPARNWLKAWENAQLSTNDKTLQADIIQYNSTNDRFYAYGEDGHQVTITQQAGVGQPGSPTRQQAVEYHPKSGKFNSVFPQFIQLIDNKTGERPGLLATPDPEAKPPKRVRPPIKPRIPPMERKGFSGR